MNYYLKYNFSGEQIEVFNSDDYYNLLDSVSAWFYDHKPTINTIGYLFDESDNLIIEL